MKITPRIGRPKKMCLTNRFLLPVLIATLGLMMLTGRATAQTFTILHSFSNTDGANPACALILSGNALYGTTAWDSTSSGTAFTVDTTGRGFTNFSIFGTSNGVSPTAGLALANNRLYGTTWGGGDSGQGTVFAFNVDGTGFTVLHGFTGTNGDGAAPYSSLILASNTLYGTTDGGGSAGLGTVFSLGTDGSGFTVLHSFTATNDGAGPYSNLLLLGDTLYGTAGAEWQGTVFALNTNGAGFRTLHSFTALDPLARTNADGAMPIAGLIASGTTLYGTASDGGSHGGGTLFKLNTDGTGFQNLHNFLYNQTNADGTGPVGGLLLRGSTLYGTAQSGGTFRSGTIFAIGVDGSGFTILSDFPRISGSPGGARPSGGLIAIGNTLYGTTYQGGASGFGTVFSLSFEPQLSVTPSGANVILTWPTNYAGFDYGRYTLQSTTNLASPVWSTNRPTPAVINGQYTVTNPISGTQQFFRLSR